MVLDALPTELVAPVYRKKLEELKQQSLIHPASTYLALSYMGTMPNTHAHYYDYLDNFMDVAAANAISRSLESAIDARSGLEIRKENQEWQMIPPPSSSIYHRMQNLLQYSEKLAKRHGFQVIHLVVAIADYKFHEAIETLEANRRFYVQKPHLIPYLEDAK